MPNHDFLLLREGEVRYNDYRRFIRSTEERVLLEDELLWVFGDSLRWVPTFLPREEDHEAYRGLNRFGPTIINAEGGAAFGRVCAAWADLLSCGPPVLQLRGPWTNTAASGRGAAEPRLRAARRKRPKHCLFFPDY